MQHYSKDRPVEKIDRFEKQKIRKNGSGSALVYAAKVS
jgi:hypothetical protein